MMQLPDAFSEVFEGGFQGQAGGRRKQMVTLRRITELLGLPLEAALEYLAERIWQLHHQGASYGLTLPGCSIAPARGVRHRDACLELLALS